MKYIARILVGILLMLAALFCIALGFAGIGMMGQIYFAIFLALAGLYVGIFCGYLLLPNEESKKEDESNKDD